MRKCYQFKQDEKGNNELLVYGDITSLKWNESDVTSFDFAEELSKCNGDLTVRINSYGGEVSEGLAMYNLLKSYASGEVTTINDGFACSSASIVFMAGAKRIMPKSSLLLIHNAWSQVQGDSNELRKQADALEKVTGPSLEIYKEVSNLDEETLIEMMDEETWIDANEALKYGFATDIQNDSANQSLENHFLQKLVLENKVLKAQLEKEVLSEENETEEKMELTKEDIISLINEVLEERELQKSSKESGDASTEDEENTQDSDDKKDEEEPSEKSNNSWSQFFKTNKKEGK